jgi:hypothetical protein
MENSVEFVWSRDFAGCPEWVAEIAMGLELVANTRNEIRPMIQKMHFMNDFPAKLGEFVLILQTTRSKGIEVVVEPTQHKNQ